MPAAQMDALGAFSYLCDNLPTWMTRLSDLTAHTTAKHAEFAEAFRKHATGPLKSRRRRNSSVCSIQTSSLGTGSQRGIRRKRGSDDSDLSSLDSGDGLAIISTRHNLIIQYDGYTQKSLEELVRNIGTARNNLRKGKMASLPLAGLLPGTRNRTVLPTLDTVEPDGQLLATIRCTRTRGPPEPQSRLPGMSPFDIADRHLELCHGLCETAAYRFLRVGGCAQELDSVKDKFALLLKLATGEVQRLKQEQKAEEVEKEAESPLKATEVQILKRPASSEGLIEVDDEEVSVESIDLTAFRANRLRLRR